MPEQPTKVVWLKMINRPFIKYHPFPQYNMVTDLRTEFNKLIDKVAAFYPTSTTIDSSFYNTAKDFDSLGNLSFQGKLNFWKKVNDNLKKLCKGKLEEEQLQESYLSDQLQEHKNNTRRNLSREFSEVKRSQTQQSTKEDIWGEAGRRSRQARF